jgi:hypothetical protein
MHRSHHWAGKATGRSIIACDRAVNPLESDFKPGSDGYDVKLEHAKWIIDTNLHWISAAEVKAGAIVAIDTAMLGALAAVFSNPTALPHSAWAISTSLLATVLLLVAMLCNVMSMLPRTEGPPHSFVFFGKIVKRTAEEYFNAFHGADDQAFLGDCIEQAYRNAEIACAKYRWVRNAMMWSFAALLPWAISLACLNKQ